MPKNNNPDITTSVLIEIRDELREHRGILKEHSTILKEHSVMLKDHSRRLEGLENSFSQQSITLKQILRAVEIR